MHAIFIPSYGLCIDAVSKAADSNALAAALRRVSAGTSRCLSMQQNLARETGQGTCAGESRLSTDLCAASVETGSNAI